MEFSNDHFASSKGIDIPSVRFEVSTAVIIKNAVFWDIKPQFVPHRRNITSSLHSPAGEFF
jgi:hypothetical protein